MSLLSADHMLHVWHFLSDHGADIWEDRLRILVTGINRQPLHSANAMMCDER